MAIRVTPKNYEDLKLEFLKGKSWRVETSPMDEHGRYHKEYICKNGDIWYEENSPVWETATARTTVRGIEIEMKQEIKLFKTEAYNTTNAITLVCYEIF